ncbi:MAG: hypothetical protein HY703_06450, partial [Gemmatimonadetes bacterium]|nr:hypothetical protein [Gemmatimonadota bacterium]
MRLTTYTRYTGRWLDALNLEALLERLADFLLQSGFAGGSHYEPWGGWSGEEADSSLDALKQELLRALIESGQLTPQMLDELRGEGKGDEAVRQEIAELLDRLVQRLIEEGYLNLAEAPKLPDRHTALPG